MAAARPALLARVGAALVVGLAACAVAWRVASRRPRRRAARRAVAGSAIGDPRPRGGGEAPAGIRIRAAVLPADEAALWADLLQPTFRAGETYCVPRDVGREDALAYWCG